MTKTESKQGLVFCAIGKRGTGKTTFTKKMLDDKPSSVLIEIYDVNDEYHEYQDKKELEEMSVFLAKAKESKGTFTVFEEATIFFTPRGGADIDMRNLLVRARHRKNIIQLNFHSFNTVPKDIKNMLNFVAIFKTLDNEDDVKNRFDNPKVLQSWQRVQKHKNIHYYEVVNLDK